MEVWQDLFPEGPAVQHRQLVLMQLHIRPELHAAGADTRTRAEGLRMEEEVGQLVHQMMPATV